MIRVPLRVWRRNTTRHGTRLVSGLNYYDSQSGVEVVIPAGVVLHNAGLSGQLSAPTASIGAAEDDPAAWERVASSVGKARALLLEGRDDGGATSATTSATSATSGGGGVVRVDLTNAFGDAAEDIQLSSGRLADLECTVIMLMGGGVPTEGSDGESGGGGGTTDFDDDDVREAVENALYNDVVGLPMSARVGVRAAPSCSPSSSWREQVEEALDLNVRHYDFCPDGRLAPRLEDLVGLLEERGVEHRVAGGGGGEGDLGS